MSISINKWNYKQMQVQVNISTHEMYIHACCNKLCARLNHIPRNSRATLPCHSNQRCRSNTK